MSSGIGADNRDRRWRVRALWLVAIAGFVMGLPALRGGFVGGDDHRLLLNHVLVNHPSFEHAVELFTTFHRDLYQPVALLSFQFEFAVANALGLFARGAEGGAWLFHLNNMLLHGLNAVIVWLVVATMHRGLLNRGRSAPVAQPAKNGIAGSERTVIAVATVSALLFAVHPLQVEVVAWTNGRMMLLSTLFGLVSLLSFASFLEKPRWRVAILTVLLIALCSLSKVRVGLPVLMAIMFVARRGRIERRAVALWVASCVMVGWFAWINIQATAGVELFAEGAEHLRGPRSARVLMALAWYFQHLVWPVGLSSYYPTPPVVRWQDPIVLRAILVCLPSFIGIAWLCRRSIVARLGTLWFFSTLAATLPIAPARNVLAADRYMYLPIIGVLWAVAALGYGVYQRRARPDAGRVLAVVGGGVTLACVAMCWHVARFYNTPLAKTKRTAALFPDTPRVWEPLGWTYYGDGEYDLAIECAQKELRHDAPAVQSGAHQLLGLCELRRGNHAAAIEHLQKAIDLNPKDPRAYYRLGTAFEEMGMLGNAVEPFERAVELGPLHNIRRNHLAAVYRQLGRSAEARAVFEGSLAENPYDVTATMGLVELDIAAGTKEALQAARDRLEALLAWMPENVQAMTNLGAVYVTLQDNAAAEAIYREALSRDPDNVTVTINLAQLYYAAGDRNRAGRLFAGAAKIGPTSLAEAVAVHDFFESVGSFEPVIGMWEAFATRYPENVDADMFRLWSYVQAGRLVDARARLSAVGESAAGQPLLLAASTMVQLEEATYDRAWSQVETLCSLGERGSSARQRLVGSLERFDQRHPDIAWTFCLTARLLLADGRLEPAGVFIGLCEARCGEDQACGDAVARLRERMADQP